MQHARATLHHDHLPGPPADAGFAYGRRVPHLYEAAFHEEYVARLMAINRVERDDLARQVERWLEGLPANFQLEIDGIAAGARVPVLRAAEFLYADIARPTRAGEDAPEGVTAGRARAVSPATDGPASADAPAEPPHAGPMCSGVITRLAGERGPSTWAARNCDWLPATLTRGTAAVTHAVPGRIPVAAVGIRGDIDVDTGINAERLWLHLHTLLAMDDPPRDRTCISWLFWAREALERCATLDELERFIESTGRDRGVIAIAVDGKSGAGAIFECSKSAHRRHDFDPASPTPLFATNHTQDKAIDAAREAKSRPGSTVARFCVLRRTLAEHPPEHGPDDLIELLAEPGIEMRLPPVLRTIYAAVCDTARDELWFASGDPAGAPAASTGRWQRVRLPWGR